MRIVLRAALMAASLASIGPAYAGENERSPADTTGVLAEAPADSSPSVATAQGRRAVGGGESRSDRNGWLFPPIGKYLAE